MKPWILVLVLSCSFPVIASVGVKGTVLSQKDCGSTVMVWLSLDKDNYKERLLLMHTEVPVGGSFQFYLKPGNYQVRASDEKGCDFLQKVKVSEAVFPIEVKMVKR